MVWEVVEGVPREKYLSGSEILYGIQMEYRLSQIDTILVNALDANPSAFCEMTRRSM